MTAESAKPRELPPVHLSFFNDTGLHYARVERPGDEPPPEKGMVDVAVLDMNHRYPNLGHFSVVETLLGLGHRERHSLGQRAPAFRVISYDVRARGAVPAGEPSRFAIVVGTGGPGALDPRQNDGVAPWAQGVLEDPSWEGPLYRFLDALIGDERAAFLGICHSFGVLSRWAGVAESMLRSDAKGKSQGVVRNVLSDDARRHPWFSGFYDAMNGPVIEVLDSRLFDLVPTGRGKAALLAYESRNGDGQPGDAVTMIELARDAEGTMPRVWGVNHHPEIGDKGLQRDRLNRLAERGEVTPEWVGERRRALQAWNASGATEHLLQWTSSYTFERPVRRLIARALADGAARAATG